MTIKLENVCHNTDWLIAKQPRLHYKTSVKPGHWQLRSLIGAAKQDTLYYPSGNGNLHIQKLNTFTRESETVKIVSFSPRSLVAQNGWVCCGGETGEFAAIPLDKDAINSTEAESDGRLPGLPPDLDLSRQDDALVALLTRPRTTNKNMVARYKVFGADRVNCITMWFPPTRLNPAPCAYEYPVAVLANNDKHVTIVKMTTMDALEEITYPDCVNRAVLSPDGRLLIAICDDPYLYIHQRAEKEYSSENPSRSGDKVEWEWQLTKRIHLKSQRKEDTTDSRGSFAACFSNTGKYLAVGTQYGVISVFDVAALTESEDALVTCFTSSRPNNEAGAVREMSFCPGPFDLLAWTEDRGAVGVADVRSNFISKQVLQISDDSAYDHISITEKNTIDPRLLDNRSDRNDRGDRGDRNDRGDRSDRNDRNDRGDDRGDALTSIGLSIDLGPSETRQVRIRDSRYHYPLTADETQVLEALQEHRRRREQREQRQRNVMQEYAAPWSSRPSARSTLATDSSRTRDRSASVSRAVSDILGNIHTQRERLYEAQQRLRARDEAERRRLVTPVPPRRAGAIRTADNDSTSVRESLASRLTSNLNTAGGGGGWSDIDALYNISFEGARWGDSLRLVDIDAETRDRMAFLDSLTNHPADDDHLQFRLRTYGASRLPPKPDETAGLAWSEDGSILYVAAEAGIYEFHVNIMTRKLHPSLVLR